MRSGRRSQHRHPAPIVLLALFVLWGPTEAWSQSTGICDRTPQVRDEILSRLSPGTACGDVTAQQLAGINQLTLSDSEIDAFQSDDFSGLTSMQFLNITGTSITTLPAGVFEDLGQLEVLTINRNSLLTTVPSGTFRGLTSLVHFNFYENGLTTLPSDVFDDLPSLLRLYIHTNALATVPPDLFSGLPNLEILEMGDNLLTEIPAGLFRGLSSLKQLIMPNNLLTTLPDGIFVGLTSLQLLYIYGNQPDDPDSFFPFLFTFPQEGSATEEQATVRVRLGLGVPLPGLQLSLSAEGGTVSPAMVSIAQGETESAPVTVTRTGDGPVTLILSGLSADLSCTIVSVCWSGFRFTYRPLTLWEGPAGTPIDDSDDVPGSQLLFITDTGISARDQAGTGTPASRNVSDLLGTTEAAQKNFISVANTNEDRAVTVLFQYHNDEMKRVLWYLRVLRAGATVLVDPFDHEIPGTADGKGAGGRVNVKDILFDTIPALSSEEDAGFNSGRFVIAVTAVGANTVDDPDTSDDESNTADTANILFPTFLAKDLHGVDNIDNCGEIRTAVGATGEDNNLEYTGHGADGANDCSQASDAAGADDTSRNVGDLSIHNYQPLAFNWLTGHHTAAQLLPDLGEGIAWGVNALTRPAIATSGAAGAVHIGIDVPYTVLDGANGGRLAPKVHGGAEEENAATDDDNRADDSGAGAPVAQDPTASENNRVVNGGALVWPALYRTAHEEQRVRFLSVADDYGDPGEYQLLAARTLYRIALHDAMGNVLSFPETDLPVFGGLPLPEPPPSLHVLVDGIGVLPNASPADCIGNARVEGWSLADLTDIVPSAAAGGTDFAGLDAPVDPETNASPGWVRFHRTQVTCTRDFGDGDPSDSAIEIPDGVPTQDKRSFIGGTVVVEKETANRTFVTAGQVVVRFLTPHSAFGASWWLGED